VEGGRVDGLRLPAAADLLPHRLPAESLWGRDYGSPRFYLRISSVPAASCSCSFATSMATKLRSVVLPRDLVHGTRGRDRAGRGREENSPEENERPGACVVARVLRAGVPIQYKASTSKGSHLCRFHIHRIPPVRLSNNGGCYPQPHRRRAGRARLSSYVSVDSVYKTLGIWLRLMNLLELTFDSWHKSNRRAIFFCFVSPTIATNPLRLLQRTTR
jgi:hypothetical protein